MAALRYAQISFKDRRAGTLRETPEGGTVFEYDPQFSEDIACALPRAHDSHTWPVGLHPVFEHLGPEGWLRHRQARAAEIAIEDDFGILLAYGADCIGAISVHAPGEPPASADEKHLDELTAAAVEGKRTISGVQPKLLVAKGAAGFIPAGATGPAPYIAKFPSDDLPGIVANEALALKAARLLLGRDQVVAAEPAVVEGIPRPALIVRRFDRTPEGEKLRLEDFAQILSKPRRRDFSGKYDAGFEDIGAAIGRHSVRAEIDLLRFFQRIVAYALIGNCDCHLKNFSLLETTEGLRLSPAYDIVNTYIYGAQGYSTRFGLRIDDRLHQFDRVDRDLLAGLGLRLGLSEQAVARTFEGFGKKKGKVVGLIPQQDRVEESDFRALFADTLRAAYLRICP
ncbi:MAG: HipA domain-containing protein [Proteobacteria bacterium]|nr:HipA domain-containing protein [Pseudomonadota bacterium]